ncbi:hypothetical protein RJ641_030286 [Dillenia turbinata]|uniref:Uncharacterized protein n=1 Tax=Dillenia turbinata TaxID=194707 RepID=A0AAN8ZNX6_9MAGN
MEKPHQTHLLFFYSKMIESGIRPNSYTFMYLIKALISRTGLLSSQFVSSALLGFYVGVCCFVNRGRQVFGVMGYDVSGLRLFDTSEESVADV